MHKYTQDISKSQIQPQIGLLNIKQASKILGVHPDTLRRWEKEGTLVSIRLGARRDRRYQLADVERMIQNTDNINSTLTTMDPKKLILESKAILFDVADTLITPFPSRGGVLSNIALDRGIKVNPELAEQVFRTKYNDWEKEKLFSDEYIQASSEIRKKLYIKLNADILKECNPASPYETLLAIGEDVYINMYSNSKCWKVIDGVENFLIKQKEAGKRLGVIDNWNKNMFKILEDLHLSNYFEFIISGGELGIRKPSRDIFIHSLNLLNLSSEKVVFIGDRYIDDILGSKSANIQPILYDPKHESKFVETPKFSLYSEL